MGAVMSMLSQFMHASEKMIACFTSTMLITCIIATFIVILALGIGLGYNYCFVDIKTKHRYVPAGYRYPGGHRHPYYGPGQYYYTRAGEDKHSDFSTSPVQSAVEETTLPVTKDTLPETTVLETIEYRTEASLNSTTSLIFITTDLISNSSSALNSTSTEASSIVNETISNLTAAVVTPLPPMIIPINGLDLIALLSKLRSENRNYSLQIVTT